MAGCDCDEIGSRTTRVVIEKPKTTTDAGGHVDLSQDSNWQIVGRMWVSVKTRGGSESRVFNQVQAEVTHIMEGNYSEGRNVIPKWRFRIGTRKLNITAAYDIDEQHRTMRFETSEAR